MANPEYTLGGRMQRLRSVTASLALVALCCVGQPAPELKAGDQWFPGRVIAGAESVAAASPATAGTQLAKSGKNADDGNWKRMGETVVSEGNEPTKVQIKGNGVFVPVTLMNGGNEVDVHLLLDTGAAATMIHTDVAERLYLDLGRAKKARMQVVGGGVIEAGVVRINRLTVGPHTKRNWTIVVVPHEGSGARYDGLLGMDVLRGLKYRVDFKKQLIIWE
jgi:clan AA aspartic protease (TIGR02281 family)